MLKKILKREYLTPVIVLSVICLVVAGMLGAVNLLTSKVVKDAEREAIRESLSDIMPGAEFGDAYLPDGAPESVVAVYEDKGGSGYAVLIETKKTYTGRPIAITVGVDTEGVILGARITKTSETKGTALVADFASGLRGLTAEQVASVDLVGGVTFSSTGVKEGVLDALVALGFYTRPEAPLPEAPADTGFPVYSFIGWMLIAVSVGATVAYIIFRRRRLVNEGKH